MALVGHGPVASVFGRLRPGVVAVDVDVAHGQLIVGELVNWCVERGLWHVVRQSGRPGHAHVIVVVGDQAGELEAFAATVRAAHGVHRTDAVQVRTALRPLSAPHRHGLPTSPPKRLRTLVRSLPAALRALDPATTSATRHASSRSAPPPLAAHTPMPRPRRELPEAWARYLREGTTPPQVRGWADQSRSIVESCCSWWMLRCGWSVDEAWTAIATAHPRAMVRTRERRRGRAWWVRHVWNPKAADMSRDVLAGPPVPRQAPVRREVDSEVGRRVAEVRAAFLGMWTTRWGRDERHTIRFVVDWCLDRMLREDRATVPCPQRDLVADRGLSRPAIGQALTHLHQAGLLVYQRSFLPGSSNPDRMSHHVSLPEESPLLLHFPPCTSPPPALPHDLQAELGSRACHLWAALPDDTAPGSSPTTLGPAAGTCSPDEEPSPSQVRVLLCRLHALAKVGLARCDAEGRWTRLGPQYASAELRDAARRSHRTRLEQVRAERADYAQRASSWAKQRDVAVARSRRQRYHAGQRLWAGHSRDEQERRRCAYQHQFAALTPTQQQHRKDDLARRRAESGVASEESVRQAWLANWDPADLAQRAAERAAWYAALPRPLQFSYATAWAEYRERWGTSREGDTAPARVPSPATATSRTAVSQVQLELLTFDDDPLTGRLPLRIRGVHIHEPDEVEVSA